MVQDLYRELSVLDKLEQEDQQKNLEGTNSSPVSKGDLSMCFLYT